MKTGCPIIDVGLTGGRLRGCNLMRCRLTLTIIEEWVGGDSGARVSVSHCVVECWASKLKSGPIL